MAISNLDEKYNVVVFYARPGYYTLIKKIVNNHVKKLKETDPNVMVLEDMDDKQVKTWIIGRPEDIKRMVDDGLKHEIVT